MSQWRKRLGVEAPKNLQDACQWYRALCESEQTITKRLETVTSQQRRDLAVSALGAVRERKVRVQRWIGLPALGGGSRIADQKIAVLEAMMRQASEFTASVIESIAAQASGSHASRRRSLNAIAERRNQLRRTFAQRLKAESMEKAWPHIKHRLAHVTQVIAAEQKKVRSPGSVEVDKAEQ